MEKRAYKERANHMTKEQFIEIEKYMLSVMKDSAHDCEHIYRVLYSAIDIAEYEHDVNMDVLIAACLLHDIGRQAQFDDPSLCHAKVGSEMAYEYLLSAGWDEKSARHVSCCISSHRYRNDNTPETIEAKILFDADKLEAAGVTGIARTLVYKGQVSDPLYTVDDSGNILDGTSDSRPSFFHEYNFKLRHVYDRFYTKRGDAIAESRREAAERFYENLLNEVTSSTNTGKALLEQYFR